MLGTLLGVGVMAAGVIIAVVCLVSLRDWPSIYSRGGFGEPPLTRGEWLFQCIGGTIAGVLIACAGWWMLNLM